MTRFDWAKILLSVRRQYPASMSGAASQIGCDVCDTATSRQLQQNIAKRQAMRQRAFA